jgi:hypothetical protein
MKTEMIMSTVFNGDETGVSLVFNEFKEAGTGIVGDEFIFCPVKNMDGGIDADNPLVGAEVVFENHGDEEPGKIRGLPGGEVEDTKIGRFKD